MNVCVLPRIYMLKSCFKGGDIRICGFWEVLGYECGTLMNGINAYKRGSREMSSSLYHVRIPWEVWSPEEGSHQTMLADTMILDFHPSKLWAIVFVLYKLSSLLYFVTVAQMDCCNKSSVWHPDIHKMCRVERARALRTRGIPRWIKMNFHITQSNKIEFY